MEILNNKQSSHSSCCSGHCHSDSQTLETTEAVITLSAQSGETVTTFKVMNMDCADEIKAINEALKMEGVLKISANLMASTVQILHHSSIEKDLLQKKLESTVVKVVSKENNAQKALKKRSLLVISSGLLLSLGLLNSWTFPNATIELILFAFSILMSGSLVFPKALGSLQRKSLDMNVLMTLATIGAFFIKEYSEAAAVVFLFALSELLESFSVQRARKAIEELLNITPQFATLIATSGEHQTIPVAEAKIGQTLLVKAGEKIPTDAIVKKGESTVDQAPLTGESIPVPKVKGDNVFAGTINQNGSMEIEVSKVFEDSKISQVIRLVEEAQSQKAVSQKFVDRFAHYYTPSILILAALTYLVPSLLAGEHLSEWFYKALTLLVIACPCALVISTPVSIVSGLTYLAKMGVLVKGGVVLETLGAIRAIALDKTGTITKGKPTVQKILRLNSYDEKSILEIASGLESHSTHPMATAIKSYAKNIGVSDKTASDFKNYSGLGIEATIDGHLFFLGNHKFFHDNNLCSPELEKELERLEQESYSLVIVGHKPHHDCKGEVLGVLALGDEIKENSKSAIASMKAIGIEKVIMLSGDNQKTTMAIAQKVGIDEAHGNLLPEDKLKEIESLKKKYGTISMIGDGINDAPAMASSSLSIAMGAAGSDVAIEVADVALMTDDLSMVAKAVAAGRRTLRVIKFNIGFSLITKVIFLILTFVGFTNLWLAVAADTGVALLVILNSLRLLKE